MSTNGSLFIASGATATNIVENGGYVQVDSGGFATFIPNVIQGTSMYDKVTIHSGTTLTNVYIASNASAIVYDGGSATSVTMDTGGNFYVSGGILDYLIMNDGKLTVASGCSAINIDRRGGTVNSATGAYIRYYNCEYISSGQTVILTESSNSSYLIDTSGILRVSSGGITSKVTCNTNGKLYTYPDGVVSNLHVSAGGLVYVSGGTIANLTKADNSTTKFYICGGGLLDNSSGSLFKGEVYVSSGGSLTVNHWGTVKLYAYSGCTISGTSFTHNTNLYLYAAPNTYVNCTNDGETIQIDNGYISGFTATTAGGIKQLTVVSGGIAENTAIDTSGILRISSGGTGDVITISSGGSLIILSGGTALNINNSGGIVSADTGAYITYVGYNNVPSQQSAVLSEPADSSYYVNGVLYISSGGTTTNDILERGTICVYDGGYIASTSISAGHLVISGGSADDIYATCASFGNATMHGVIMCYGGTINNVSIYSAVSIEVGQGGIINSMVTSKTNNYNSMYVLSDGRVNDVYTTLRSNVVFPGGVISNITLDSNAVLIVSSGGTALNVDYDPITGNVSALEGAYVTYLSSKFTGVYYGSTSIISQASVMSNITIGASGKMTVLESGIAISNTANYSGVMYISSGGTANYTTIKGGTFHALSGGIANSTTLSSGVMYVSDGCEVNHTTINSGGRMLVQGSVVNSTTINDGGRASAYYGGSMDYVAVNFRGSLVVSSGGTATSIVENGGDVIVNDGAIVTFVPTNISNRTFTNSSYYSATVHSGTTLTKATFNARGDIYIHSGGIVNSATLSAASMTVLADGSVNNIGVNSSGYLIVEGVADNVNVNQKGTLFVSSGGTATNVLENGGCVKVEDNTSVVFKPNTMIDRIISSGISTTVHDQTVISGAVINGAGRLEIYKDGICSGVVLDPNGYIEVFSGGTALSVDYSPFSNTHVISHEGAYVTFTSEYSGMYYCTSNQVYTTSSLDNVVFMRDGIDRAYILNGGSANNINISNGVLHVGSGGIVNGVDVQLIEYPGGADLKISAGGSATSVILGGPDRRAYPMASAESGASIDNVVVNANAALFISSGATATSIVENGGYVSAEEGATVTFIPNVISNLTMDQYHYGATLHSGTTLTDTILSSGRSLSVIGGTIESSYIYAATISDGHVNNVSFGGTYEDVRMYNTIGTNIYIYGHTDMYMTSGYISNLIIQSGLNTYSNAYIENLTIANGYNHYIGQAVISSAKLTQTVVELVSGGTMCETSLMSGGQLYVYNSGVASNVTFVSGGILVIYSGASADNVAIARGTLIVEEGGTATNITSTGGSVSAHPGAYVTYV